jgi:DNA-binding SARP family transcriptional activator/Tfp pilus assembly protein PilF
MAGTAMRIRLLGDVAAHLDSGQSDGATVDLGHDRQRCVLAVLLVEPGRPVPVDVLLDRAWGDRLPRHPREALYSYVSRLRQALAPGGYTVVRRRGGYLVDIDPLVVDLHLFDHLIGQARAAADDQFALERLDEALGLWTGDPFGALDTPWLNAAREALNRRRRTAERNRDELALRLGRHATVVDGLLAQADREPFDERLAELALLALYRCGRPAEALARYERLRRALAEQLGTEPGAGLRDLYRRMMQADPALTSAAPTDPVPHVACEHRVPHQLPGPPAGFTGRERQLAELTDALQPPTAAGMMIAVVGGVGGIGKSWLALHWANQHRQQFPDGQLYANLRGFDPSGDPVDPASAIRSFLAALGVTASALPPEPDDQGALFRSLVANRRMLLVLDNARDSAQVVPLLPGSPSTAVLVTSRRRLTGLVAAHGARSIGLELMTRAEAAQLLRTRVGGARVAAEPGAFDALVPLCAGLPLALGIVAARAAIEPRGKATALVAELSDRRTRLDAFDAGDLAVSLRAVMAGSVRTLSPGAARLFGHLSLAPGPDIGLAAAASMTGCHPSALRPVLRELVDANLLDEAPELRFRMHDLVRLYGIELASGLPHARAAMERLLDYFLHTACAADRRLDPLRDPLALPAPRSGGPTFDSPRAALAWLGAEYDGLLSAVRYAESAGLHRHAWQLAWALVYILDQRGNWHAEVAVHRAALRSARHLADDTAMAHAHRGLGRGYTWLGRFDDAREHLRAALAAYERLGDRAGQGHVYRSLARVSARQGVPRRALDDDRRALAMFEAAGHDYGRAQTLNALGWHHAHLGEPEPAAAYCRKAIALQQRLGDRRGEALTWDTLGYSHYRGERPDRAVGCYQRAVALLHTEADAYWEAVVTEHLGDACAAVGRREAAQAAWERSARLLTALGHPDVRDVQAKLSVLPAVATTSSE